jgi:hypothetical protein
MLVEPKMSAGALAVGELLRWHVHQTLTPIARASQDVSFHLD